MNNSDTIFTATNNAIDNFEKIKRGLQGIYDILKLSYSDDNIYFLLAQDNIQGVFSSLLELLANEDGTKELIEKIKRAEIDLDIPLDNLM